MSQNLYILPPDSMTMVIGVFAGLGFFLTVIVGLLAVLKSKGAICKPAEKDELEKLNSIEGLQSITDDNDELMETGRSRNEKKTKKKEV